MDDGATARARRTNATVSRKLAQREIKQASSPGVERVRTSRRLRRALAERVDDSGETRVRAIRLRLRGRLREPAVLMRRK